MKKLELRRVLAVKYGEEFDARLNWLSELLNYPEERDNEELTLLLYYRRSKFYAPITSASKIPRLDASLLAIADKSLQGEILIKFDKTYKIIAAQYYTDESGNYYTPKQIIKKCLYFAIEGQDDCDLLFGRSYRSKIFVQQYIQKNQEPIIVLMVEPCHPDYYIISSSLLS